MKKESEKKCIDHTEIKSKNREYGLETDERIEADKGCQKT